jgi:hypothetical protein
VGVVAGIVVAIAVGGYLWMSGGDSPRETADAPVSAVAEQGVACPHLREAFNHNQAGDAEALQGAVDAAARASEQALQQSGQEFGRPEEIAIELQYSLHEDPGQSRAVATFLSKARDICTSLGRWASDT